MISKPDAARVIVLALLAAGPAQAQLAARIDSLADTPPFHSAHWGILIEDLDGTPVYSRNADRLFMPASTNKLIVTAAAAHHLPSDFTVETTVWGTGPLTDGVLLGDMVVYGRGDPTFSERCYGTDTTMAGACETMWSRMDLLADSIAAAGIRRVAGSLVADASWFEPTTVHPGWEVYDLNWWYAAPVTSLAFNDNSLNLTWGPGPSAGAPPAVSIEPILGDLIFQNRAATVDSGGDRTIDFFRQPGTMSVWAEGTVPLGHGERTEYFAVPDPALFFGTALRRALEQRGVSFAGPVVSTADSLRYRHLRMTHPLARLRSRPLADMVFPILNSSQNLFAEMLLKMLGATLNESGSWESAIELERRFLIDSVGVDSTSFHLSDGSGLAAGNLVSPRTLVATLRYMLDSPGRETFYNALPRSGSPGSLRSRFTAGPLGGAVVAKTGSIFHVNSLAGYVEDNGRPRWLFSIVVNNHNGRSPETLSRIDSLLVTAIRESQ